MPPGMPEFEMPPVYHDEPVPVRSGDVETPPFASLKPESGLAPLIVRPEGTVPDSASGVAPDAGARDDKSSENVESDTNDKEAANIAAARAFLANMMKMGKKPAEEAFKEALKEDRGEKIPDTAKGAIRENLTRALAETGGGLSASLALPEEYVPGTESLRGKRIVMVDDEINAVLQSIVHGSVATNGNFDVVLQKDAADTADRLADRILEKNPDLVLVDFDFAFSVTGDMVVHALREKGYSGRIIGSSQRSDNAEAFMKVGVVNSYDKLFKLGPEEEMRGLAAAFE